MNRTVEYKGFKSQKERFEPSMTFRAWAASACFKSQKERFELVVDFDSFKPDPGFKSQKERFELGELEDGTPVIWMFQIPEGTV